MSEYKSEIVKKVARIAVLFISTPLLTWRIRTFLLRTAGVKIGRGSKMGHGCEIIGPLGNLSLGEDVFINSHAYIQALGKVAIGDAVRIGPFVKIMTRHHPIENSVIRRKEFEDYDMPMSIGRGCYIGVGVTVLPGVSIAEGCVIGAGSIVVQNTLANGLYIGIPAHRARDLPISPSNDPSPCEAAREISLINQE